MGLVTNLGYTTINNKWEILTNKELAKHDLLLNLYTSKGECDWNPDFGTTIQEKLFQPKTIAVRDEIKNEIESVFEEDLRFTLLDLETEDIDKGWYFYCNVAYLDGTPEVWQLQISEDLYNNPSSGVYPLGE